MVYTHVIDDDTLTGGLKGMAYQIGLCDDEIYQVKVNNLYIKEIAKKNGYEVECHGFQNGKQLKNYLSKNSLDVLFLDIDLGQESGIEIAAWLSANYPQVITVFVTGHREFAEEAFEVEALGYLVKPYDIKKMENVVNRVMKRLESKSQADEKYEIVITDENIKKKLDYRDILYIERQQAKSIIRTAEKEYQVYETITSLCERIGEEFIRVNQSEVINPNLIDEIKGNTVYLKDGRELSIGRTYRKEVLEKYFG